MDPFRAMGETQSAFLRFPCGRVPGTSSGIPSWKNRVSGPQQGGVGGDFGNGPAVFRGIHLAKSLIDTNQYSLILPRGLPSALPMSRAASRKTGCAHRLAMRVTLPTLHGRWRCTRNMQALNPPIQPPETATVFS